MFEARTMA